MQFSKQKTRFWAKVLAVLTGGYGLLLSLMYTWQERLVFYPWRDWAATPTEINLFYEDVRLQTADGVGISGWFVPHPQPRGTVLFLHGNAGNISQRLDTLALLHRLGLNTFIIDYRGYGRSDPVQPTEPGTYHDAEAAWRYLTEIRGLDSARIVLFGRSLGGGVATWLAQEHRPRALILESTFTSVPDVAARHYPFLPVRQLMRVRYPNVERLPTLNVPLLIVHSPHDTLIPFEHGQHLFEVANSPKTFLEISGNHADGYLRSMAVYEPGLAAFFDEVLPTTVP